MELHIAGGCGEHGRNCFHVIGAHTNFLVDCGIMAGESIGYPSLLPEEIPQIQTVFLTHSHKDHTGALEWLYRNGFCGEIVASAHTLAQIDFHPAHSTALETICPCLHHTDYHGIDLSWGRSGHCLGSVWYRFEAEGSSILFSGDYTEDSPVYRVDAIRNQTADLAVLDCAYGKANILYADACKSLLLAVPSLLEKHGTVVFSVPKYGRGLDLFYLLTRAKFSSTYYGDAHFIRQVQNIAECHEWYKIDGSFMADRIIPYDASSDGKVKRGIVFISDPQLKDKKAAGIVSDIILSGGIAVMTGTVDTGSYSETLIRHGKMLTYPYPVHLQHAQYLALAAANNFHQTIPYHTSEFRTPQPVPFGKRR